MDAGPIFAAGDAIIVPGGMMHEVDAPETAVSYWLAAHEHRTHWLTSTEAVARCLFRQCDGYLVGCLDDDRREAKKAAVRHALGRS